MKFTKAIEGDRVQFDFGPAGSIQVEIGDLNEEMQQAAMLHGLSQKIGDSYAGKKDPDEAREAARAVIQQITNGEWNRKAGDGGILVDALMRASGRDRAECQAAIGRLSEDERKKVRKQLAPQIKEIEYERAQGKVTGKESGVIKSLFE